jgi:hypothetical protein
LELLDTVSISIDKSFKLHNRFYNNKYQLVEIKGSLIKSYYYKNMLLVEDSSDVFTIYKINEMVDATLFGGNIYDFICDSLYYKDGE